MTQLQRITEKNQDWEAMWRIIDSGFLGLEHDKGFLIDHEYYALKDESGMVVAAAIADSETPRIVGLSSVAVARERRHQGLGSDLLVKLAQTLSERFRVACIYCKPSLKPFYDVAGFEVDTGTHTAHIIRMHKKLG